MAFFVKVKIPIVMCTCEQVPLYGITMYNILHMSSSLLTIHVYMVKMLILYKIFNAKIAILTRFWFRDPWYIQNVFSLVFSLKIEKLLKCKYISSKVMWFMLSISFAVHKNLANQLWKCLFISWLIDLIAVNYKHNITFIFL